MRGPGGIRTTIIMILAVMGCYHASTMVVEGRWNAPGIGEVDVGFGLMTMSNPNAVAFSDAGSPRTTIPVLAWSWNGTVHILPAPFAKQTGSFGGPDNRRAPLLPVRFHMRSTTLRRIDRCTLTTIGQDRSDVWQRISPSCPEPVHPMRAPDPMR